VCVCVCVFVCVWCMYVCLYSELKKSVFYLIDSLGDFSVLIYRFACICFMFFYKNCVAYDKELDKLDLKWA